MSRGESALALTGALFLFGALLITILGSRAARGRGELWRTFADTAGMVAAVLIPAAIHPALFTLVAAAAGYRCALELFAIHHASPRPWVQGALGALLAAAAWLGSAASAAALMLISAAVLLIAAPIYGQAVRARVTGARAFVLASGLPVLAVGHLAHLAYREEGFLWVFFLYATVEVQDSMAFLFGRFFGRRRLAARLSPAKTLVGAIAGWAFGFVAGTAIATVLLEQGLARAALLAALVVAAGFAGDLLASGLKRAAGVKDFPRLSVRQGGLLDMFDSTLVAAIVLGSALWLT